MKENQIKYGIYLSYISIFVTNISNLILTPFIIRSLGQSEYGLYILIGALVGYITILDFGLSNTTVRFVAKYKAENNKPKESNFLAMTTIIYFIISVIVLIVGLAIYMNLDIIFGNSLTPNEISTAKVMFLILVISLAISMPINLLIGIISAYEEFIYHRSINIFKTIVRVIIIALFLFMGYKAIAIVLIDAILNLLLLILHFCFVFFKLKVNIKLLKFDIPLFKEILSYSSLIFISVVVDQLYWRIGHLILGVLASTSAVSVFGIGMIFSQYFITFSTAISGVFLPKITRMVSENTSSTKLTDLMIKTGRLQLIVICLLLTGFLLFGQKFIYLWAGSDYTDSWYIALIVIIPLSVTLTQTIGISILQAKNLHGFRAIIYICIAIMNIFLSIYLTKRFGLMGTAMGTALSLIFGNIIIMNLYYHFKVGLNMKRFFKEISKGLLLSCTLSIITGISLLFLTSHTWVILFSQIALYIILYSIITYFIGMNKFEKNLFSKEFTKILRIKN